MMKTSDIARTARWIIASVSLTTSAWSQDEPDTQELTQPTSPPPTYMPPLPADGPPAFSKDTLYPEQSSADVHFDPDDPNVRLMTLSGVMPVQRVAFVRRGWWRPRSYFYGVGAEPVYASLCEGPCDLRLMRGPYNLALSKADGSLIPVEGPQVIAGPSTLHAHYADRSGLRTAGALVGIVGTIGGIVMMFESVHDKETCDAFGYCQTQTDVSGALLAGGIGVFIGSAVVGSILVFQRDEAQITITPLRLPNVVRTGEKMSNSGVGNSPLQGAGMTISF